jgi:tripartite-type tricarboxylate transporter receptor subunit TctC
VKWCRANPKQATYGTADAFKAGLARLSRASHKEFAQRIKSDFDRWGPIVQASGFSPEDCGGQ